MSDPTAPALPGQDESDVTRLLCAGVYLDTAFRTAVIRELLTDWHRVVAPSYGYDAVPVLAHALAARTMRRTQVWITALGAVAGIILLGFGTLDFPGVALLFGWLAWTVAYLRRVATLEALTTRLTPGRNDSARDDYPQSAYLSRELVLKISREQRVRDGVVYYGGYTPFVGAGTDIRTWSTAQLLLPAPNPLAGVLRPATLSPTTFDGAAGPALSDALPVIPFTVGDITEFVAKRMREELEGDQIPLEERINALNIDMPRYRKATGQGRRSSDSGGIATVHWQEDYDAERQYLCIRVGSWKQELVTSIFVGFDLKGNTLHTEFRTYVLPPILEGYHLVDRLPADDGSLAVLVAGQMIVGLFLLPRTLLRRAENVRRLVVSRPTPPHTNELGMDRYASDLVDRGAVTSVRELAASDTFLHYFQQTDAKKYTKVVERRLLMIIQEFLTLHRVDLADHRALQATILNGDVNTHTGTGHLSVRTSGTVTQGSHSPVTAEAGRP